MRLGKGEVVTAAVADEKRGAVMRYAAAQGIAVNRQGIEALTLDQITGLGDAARSGDKGAFLRAAVALGIATVAAVADGAPQAAQEPPKERAPRQPRQPKQEAPPPPVKAQEPEPAEEPPPVDEGYDPDTGEVAPADGAGGELDFK